jgi:hypothetical protein
MASTAAILIRTVGFSGAWAATIAPGDRRVPYSGCSLYEFGEYRAQVFREELHFGALSGKAADIGFLVPAKMEPGSGETIVSGILIAALGSPRLCWPG